MRNGHPRLDAAGAMLVLGIAVAAAQAPAGPSPADLARRLLATRDELTAIAGRSGEATRRLREGDFIPGDLILLEVQGEPALSDTFTVGADRAVTLPAPTVGSIELRGVLRSEAEGRVRKHLARFLHSPVVRTKVLVRLALAGEVARAGYYAVAADAPLSDALMAAHGVTADGDLAKVRMSRGGRTILAGRALRDAIARGWTVDDAGLRNGDAITVGRGRGDIEGKLRFLWVVVSLTGGIYGLTRAL